MPPAIVVCRAAATAGNLATLQWLQAQPQRCPLTAHVALAAAEACQLEVLQWLIAEAGCPYDTEALWHVAFTKAAAAGNAAGPAIRRRLVSSWKELYCYIETLGKQR